VQRGALVWQAPSTAVIESLAFSPDGLLIATGGSFQDSNVVLWETSKGSIIRTLEGHAKGVSALLFSPSGQILISASYDGEMRLWGIRP
jgi:WD40 repeat protein